MEKVILNAEIREETGKSKVKALRRGGLIPAVMYRGRESMNLKVNERELFGVLHTSAGENVLLTVKIKGDKKAKERACLIKELQRDPVSESIIHADLNEISLTEKIKVKVPIKPRGQAEGVVKDGGVLEHVLWEAEVECLPTDIPEKIEVEVGAMKIGDAVYVKDLKVPPEVKIISNPDLTVLSVAAPAKEEVVAEAPAEGVEEPEVIAKGKKEEEEEAEEAGKEGKKEEKPKKEETPGGKKEEKKPPKEEKK